jgi:hypothetical protein
MRFSKTALRWFLLYAVGACAVFAAGPGFTTRVPGSIMDQFRAQRTWSNRSVQTTAHFEGLSAKRRAAHTKRARGCECERAMER